MSCVFCRIVAGEIPATFVHQDDEVVAFRDTTPTAPVHVLVVPRRHVANVLDLAGDDGDDAAEDAAHRFFLSSAIRSIVTSAP